MDSAVINVFALYFDWQNALKMGARHERVAVWLPAIMNMQDQCQHVDKHKHGYAI